MSDPVEVELIGAKYKRTYLTYLPREGDGIVTPDRVEYTVRRIVHMPAPSPPKLYVERR